MAASPGRESTTVPIGDFALRSLLNLPPVFALGALRSRSALANCLPVVEEKS
jgi:hypothetical protein